MFDHSDIEKYDFEKVPLNRDIYLMGEEWIGDYEKALLDGLNGKKWTYPGFISYAAAGTFQPTVLSCLGMRTFTRASTKCEFTFHVRVLSVAWAAKIMMKNRESLSKMTG